MNMGNKNYVELVSGEKILLRDGQKKLLIEKGPTFFRGVIFEVYDAYDDQDDDHDATYLSVIDILEFETIESLRSFVRRSAVSLGWDFGTTFARAWNAAIRNMRP